MIKSRGSPLRGTTKMSPKVEANIKQGQASRRVPSTTARSAGPYTPQTGQGPGGVQHKLPPAVTLGDGWTHIGGSSWSWDVAAQTEATQFPVLTFGDIVQGNTYRCTGRIDYWDGTGTTLSKVNIHLGSIAASASFNMVDTPAGTRWDEEIVAGADNTTLRFIIDDNITVEKFIMSRVVLVDIT